jgi:hypothetical protein
VRTGADAGSPEPKKQAFQDVAGKMGSSYGYFQGVDGSRVGSGLLAMLQGFAYASFQLMAKAAILLAQVLLRVLILAGPVIGLVALLYHQMLRAIGRVAGAALLNVVLISSMAGIHTLLLTWIFNPTRGFSVLTQMLLAALVTLVFLMVGKPLRRMGQMVELSVGTVGGGMSRVPTSVFSRFRGREREYQTGASDEFWEQVRDSDGAEDEFAAPKRGRRRGRPEAASVSVSATAHRLDRDGDAQALPSGAVPDTGGGSSLALPAPGAQRPGGTQRANTLPEGRSRLVDTAPVADAQWDRFEEDPVLVPSRAEDGGLPGAAEPPSQRRSDMEVVAGRPVNVVFRPSRGLEVAEGG